MEMNERRSHGRILGGGEGEVKRVEESATTQPDRADLSGAIQEGGAHEDRGTDDSRDQL